jgi:hypothetical protein
MIFCYVRRDNVMNKLSRQVTSTFGQKQTFSPRNTMSALSPSADIHRRGRHVRFVPPSYFTDLFDHFAAGQARWNPAEIPQCFLARGRVRVRATE